MNSISIGTIARLLAIVVVFVSQAFSVAMDVDKLTEVIILTASIGAGLWGYWKDNDITKQARDIKTKVKEAKK